MEKEILEIIKGYNQEKEILTKKLVELQTDTKNMATRSSIQHRLTEIDKQIDKLRFNPKEE